MDYAKAWPCWLRYEDDPAAVADLGSPRVGRPPRDLLGQRWGTLEVIARAENSNAGNRNERVRWICQCQDCGEELITEGLRLQEGRIFCPCTGKRPPGLGRPRSRPLPDPDLGIQARQARRTLRIRIARELGMPAAEVGRRFWQEIEGRGLAAA
jgi:hypothetical protein